MVLVAQHMGQQILTSKATLVLSIFFEINAEFKRLEKQVDAVKIGLKKIEAPVIKSY